MKSAPYPARLVKALGEIARRGLSGRLLLAAGSGESAGYLDFQEGRLVGLRPPAPDPPANLSGRDPAAARRAAALA
ncbi:MAG TPA: hypothetical protein VJV23_05665, partial [Candidatus Polarisedimenticolia bacterium]|nr:hypothetical protein [Candidatus Polarisedimenticolia bacterium]